MLFNVGNERSTLISTASKNDLFCFDVDCKTNFHHIGQHSQIIWVCSPLCPPKVVRWVFQLFLSKNMYSYNAQCWIFAWYIITWYKVLKIKALLNLKNGKIVIYSYIKNVSEHQAAYILLKNPLGFWKYRSTLNDKWWRRDFNGYLHMFDHADPTSLCHCEDCPTLSDNRDSRWRQLKPELEKKTIERNHQATRFQWY
jgi:hypothetical protein